MASNITSPTILNNNTKKKSNTKDPNKKKNFEGTWCSVLFRLRHGLRWFLFIVPFFRLFIHSWWNIYTHSPCSVSSHMFYKDHECCNNAKYSNGGMMPKEHNDERDRCVCFSMYFFVHQCLSNVIFKDFLHSLKQI